VTAEGGSLSARATKGFVALLGSRLTVTGLQFVAFALLASYLGPSGMGIYTYAVSFTSLFEVATSLGFRAAVQREVAQQPDSEAHLIPNLAYLRSGLAVGAYGILAIVVVVSGYRSEARTAALVAGLYLLTVALESFVIPLEVRLRVGWIAVADVLEGVVLLVAFVVLGSMGAGAVAFLWVYVAANALNAIVCLVVASVITDFDWRPKFSTWGELLRPAAQIGVAELLIGLYFRLDLLILARFKPAADAGQYGAAVRFLVTIGLVHVLVMTILGPVMARSFVEGPDVLARRYRRAVHLITLVAFPLAVGGAMTAWRFVPTIPGFGEFDGAGRALSILAPSTALIFIGSLTSRLLLAAHLQGQLLRISAVGLVTVLVLNAALIPPFSYIGAAVATTVAELVVVGLGLRVARRELGISIDVAHARRALRGVAVMAVALVPGYLVHPWVQIGFAAICYVVALLPTGALRWSDIAGVIPAGTGTATVDASSAGGPVATWRSLRPVAACEIEIGERPVWWLPVVARLAGCLSVTATSSDRSPDVRRPRLWRWFVDPQPVSTRAGEG
jgi:O-antigen/teichoic acid export membrane protein